MKRLGIEQIKALHSLLISATGGTDGLRDEGLLDSAINSPFQTFDGLHVYKTIELKAARLGFSLIKNHPFIDGNKRTGMLALLTFLNLNSISIDCTDEEIIHIGLGIADGSIDDAMLLTWILDREK